MARTIAQIYDALNTVKSNMTELSALVTESTGSPVDHSENLILDASSGSKVANWRLWLWIVAVASWVIENVVDNRVAEISAIINGLRPHTLEWYEAETLKWQYGHELIWINEDHWDYLVDDPANRIVAAVSASTNDMGEVVIKVAKLDGAYLQPLTTGEVEGLVAFWKKWKDAGVKLQIVTAAANVLKIQATVVRNRLVLAQDGTLLRNSAINPLTDALADYIDHVPFNEIIRITDIEAAAKMAEGITDFVITSLEIRPDDIVDWVVVNREVIPSSGFARIDYQVSTFTYVDE
jgi:hypothetical protein